MLLITRLPSGCTDSATTLTVRTGEGTAFAPAAGAYKWVALVDPAGGVTPEWVACSAGDTSTLTVVRAQRNTTAAAFPAGAYAVAGIDAEQLTDELEAITSIMALTIDEADRMGYGTTDPQGMLHLATSTAAELPLFERSGQSSNNVFGALKLLVTKTSDMGDGFGPGLGFYIRDDAGTINFLGYVSAVRAGADNTGDLSFRTVTGGATNVERMRVYNTGDVGIRTGGKLLFGAVSSEDVNLYRSAANVLTTDDALTVGGALAVNGNTTLGDANTDTVTMTGRCIFRTVASDPKHATAGSRPAGSVGEVAYYSGKLYLCTNAATPTWEKITSS